MPRGFDPLSVKVRIFQCEPKLGKLMQTKTCSECKKEQGIENFHVRSYVKGTHQSYCKKCRKSRDALDWLKNKNSRKEKRRQSRKRVRAEFKAYKDSLCCALCSESSTECLDFHHKDPKEKEYLVSYLSNNGSKEKLFEEIAKCVVLCANCHRKVHSGRIIL